MRLQIALEYMIVFAFVMLIFMVVFATVAEQRASLSNQELESHIQLVAGDLASQIDIAQQSGSGYNATVQIPSSGSLLSYTLNVTGNGESIIASKIANQLISAVSFSIASSVVSNPSWLSSNTGAYSIPVTNGTLSIINEFGTICIDYACPNITGQAGTMVMSSQAVHAPQFDGQNSYIAAQSTGIPTGSSARSVFAWIYMTGYPSGGAYYAIAGQSSGGSADTWTQLLVNSNGDLYFNGDSDTYTGSNTVPLDTWTMVGYTYASGSTSITICVNTRCSSGSLSGSSALSTPSAQPFYIGGLYGSSSSRFNGGISNVQVYSSALSATQISQLSAEGIPGQPISQAGVSAWWPLNSNPNDYSGNGNNGNVIGYLPYLTVAQFFARVASRSGSYMSGALVGFASSSGTFAGGSPEHANYTNSSGIATAILTQSQANGYAVVKATTFDGNVSTQPFLVSWWPLNLGQGSSAHEVSGSNNLGTDRNVSWGLPALATGFDGKSSYIVTNANNALQTPLTVSAWVYSTEPQTLVAQNALNEIFNGGGLYLDLQGDHPCFYVNGINNNQFLCSPTAITGNGWYFIAGTYNKTSNPNLETVYINGGIANTLSVSGSSSAPATNAVSIGECEYCITPYLINGELSDVQEYSNALSPGAITSLYNEGIGGLPTPSQSNIGWWPLDGDAVDYSGHSQNGSAVSAYPVPLNSSSLSNSTSGSLYAASLTGGSSSTIQLGNSIALQPISAVSITAWINASTSQPYGFSQIASDNGSTGVQGYNFSVLNGELSFAVRQINYPFGSCKVTGTANVLNARNDFVAGVYNGTGIAVYLDGVMQSSSQCNNNPVNYSTPSNGIIGKGFNGIISNVQIYSSALSAENVSQLYSLGQGAFPISTAGLAGWYPLDGNLYDYSGNGNNGTATSISYALRTPTLHPATQSISGYGAWFNGKNSAISTGSSNLPTGSSARSVFAWVYFSGTVAQSYPIDSWGTASSTEASVMEITSGNLHFSGSGDEYQSGLSVPTDRWSFVGYTYSGSNTVTLYVNGAKSTGTISQLDTVTSAADIGNYLQTYFNGSIADVQVYDTALSQTQEYQLYKSQLPPSATADLPMTWLP